MKRQTHKDKERASPLMVVLAIAYLIILALALFKYPGFNEILRMSR